MAMIYIVEDDENIREIEMFALKNAGYEVQGFECAAAFYARLKEKVPALVLLDIMLPDEDGLTIVKKLRHTAETRKLPIIMATAKTTEIDKVKGLDIGADDYIIKPFSNMELLMRVKAILRRSSGAKAPVVTEKIPFADLILDTESRSVSRQGEMIPLTYTEFQILELLVTHKKKIYSLENIYQSIWGEDAVGDSAIMVHIKNIRKKLGDDSRNPKYIKTAWGRGYYVDQ